MFVLQVVSAAVAEDLEAGELPLVLAPVACTSVFKQDEHSFERRLNEQNNDVFGG